jgi:hypothetical protein
MKTKHMFNMAERWGQYRGTNPVRFVQFLPEDNLRFENAERGSIRRHAPGFASLFPGDGRFLNQHRA